MEKIARESYPQVALLKQVKGVGTQIALTYVLTLDDAHRFAKSRGCCGGQKVGGPTASVVGERRGVRTTAQ
jgi:hypothetical protein